MINVASKLCPIYLIQLPFSCAKTLVFFFKLDPFQNCLRHILLSEQRTKLKNKFKKLIKCVNNRIKKYEYQNKKTI